MLMVSSTRCVRCGRNSDSWSSNDSRHWIWLYFKRRPYFFFFGPGLRGGTLTVSTVAHSLSFFACATVMTARTLFGSGVLRCAACGAAVVAINALRYGCSARKDRGPSVCPQA